MPHCRLFKIPFVENNPLCWGAGSKVATLSTNHDVGKTILTIQEVVDEITNKRQLRRLVVLPYDLQLKDVFQENIKYKFSKKTGDYPSLSATDIKVIALTFQLEKEKVGTDHLQTEPKVNRVVSFTKNNKDVAVPSGFAGFYLPKKLNVMKQLGLNVLSVNGRMIRQLRTFILRCYACFKTTSIMTKIFCPNCGNKTLKKVAVSLKEDGTQQIHINACRPLTARGKRFSLPTPKGGKHANNPILVEDQRIPQQRGTRLARQRNDPLAPDYIAGFSPFIMRDVNSRAAVLGIHGQETKHWMRTNPNQAKRKHSKKKK
uniref:RNA-binding protein NOB1 n=1 Tax=Timema genevievae TaxID=629358 RepID=A0A7R9K500_TIMGE|nr:unnamed protein product [Timema genevievae]